MKTKIKNKFKICVLDIQREKDILLVFGAPRSKLSSYVSPIKINNFEPEWV